MKDAKKPKTKSDTLKWKGLKFDEVLGYNGDKYTWKYVR